MTAIMPLLWEVLCPSRVLVLLSTLSAEYWTNCPLKGGISVSWPSAAFSSNVCKYFLVWWTKSVLMQGVNMEGRGEIVVQLNHQPVPYRCDNYPWPRSLNNGLPDRRYLQCVIFLRGNNTKKRWKWSGKVAGMWFGIDGYCRVAVTWCRDWFEVLF